MSDNIKYYYLKLKGNFFDSEEMKILESQKNGVIYQNFYLKLCLLSLKSEGRLIFKDYLPYDEPMLSTVLRIDIDTVKTGLEIFIKIGLVEIMDSGLIFMTDIQSLIGSSSSEADRKKAYRERINECKKTNKGQMSGQMSPEIEKELKKELKIELKKEKEIYESKQIKASQMENFETFWSLYDKKVERTKCEKLWFKINPEAYEIILTHVELYVKSTPDKKFRKNPDTYLRNQCWNDEIISPDNKSKKSSFQDNVARLEEKRKELGK